MPDLDLDARLDELFATEPREFTAARDALSRALKADNRAADAAEVKALRRPTVAVAAVNRTARTHADQITALIELGDELAALQADAGADRDELRDLTRQRRTLLHQLTEHAASTTERPDGARAAIAATLDTASLDQHLRDDLLRGRLTQELTPAARFVLGDDTPLAGPSTTASTTAPTTPPGAPRRASRTAAAPPRDELAARRARAELEASRQRVDEADEAVREHADLSAEAADRLDAAHRHIADLEAALADARAELADAKRAERDAQRAERRARTEHDRLVSALHAAERAADESK